MAAIFLLCFVCGALTLLKLYLLASWDFREYVKDLLKFAGVAALALVTFLSGLAFVNLVLN
jgi:hypothetical protein